jgi:hypothetical protein
MLAHKYFPNVRDKKKLTETLVNQLDPDWGMTARKAMRTWWFNLRSAGGMRLTSAGYHAFTEELDLEHYSYNVDDPTDFNQQLILDMDRKLQMPYYIHAVKGIPKRVIFFGSREAMVTNLYGNLKKFLDNYNP